MNDQILAAIAPVFPDAEQISIDEPTRISEGWETEIYSFDVLFESGGEHRRELLILRIFPGQGAGPQAAMEFNAMKRLHGVGYPVPAVLLVGGEDSPFGKPFILMERIDGKTLWSFMFQPETKNKQQLLDQFCGLVVQLHNHDWRAVAVDTFDYDEKDPYQFVDQWLQSAWDQLERLELNSFDDTFKWLQDRRDSVPCTRPAVIHYDFHPNNILIKEDGSAVVIDWSNIDISDPRFDLAWTMLLVGSYESSAWRNRILESYERQAGSHIQELAFFDVSACSRRLASILASLGGRADELGMDPNAVYLIRQQMPAHKRVYDLLLERTGIHIPEIESMFVEFS